MIHRVKLPRNAAVLLRDIVEYQVVALEVAAAHSKGVIGNAVSFAPLFAAELAAQGWENSEEAAQWVARKEKTLLALLAGFADATTTEKRAFIENVRFDIEVLDYPGEATLRGAVLDKAPAAVESAKAFLCDFYDRWKGNANGSGGFDGAMVRTGRSEKYDHREYIQEFLEVNPGLYICAICDGSAYTTRANARAYTSIEHFFPRSIYPHFSCHPRNLVPICSLCNSSIKHTANPLNAVDGPIITLDQLALPYQPDGLARQAWVSIANNDLSAADDSKLRHPWKITLKAAVDFDHVTPKLKSLNDLYKIEERWNDTLNEIEEQAFRRICQFLSLDPSPAQFPLAEALVQKLKILMAITERDNLGRDPYGFMLMWLLQRYIEALEMHKESAALYHALADWAEEQGMNLRNLLDQASRIQARMPPLSLSIAGGQNETTSPPMTEEPSDPTLLP